MRRQSIGLLLIVLLGCSSLKARDNAHYFKSANLHRNPTACWFDDTRYYEIDDWAWKVEDDFMYGHASSGWDKNGNTANILNDTGAYDMKWVAENVPLTDVQIVYQNMINAFTIDSAAALVVDPTTSFGELRFDGKFEMFENDYIVRKNLKKGFFVQAYVPVRSVKIKNISYTDMSAALGPFSQQTASWQQIKNNFDQILNEFGYKPHASAFSKSGLGDVSFLLGWQDVFTKRDDEDKDVYTLNLSVKAGVLCPTGERIKTDYIFSMPTGYNNHWGLSGAIELDLGVTSWLSIDMFGGFTWFFDDNNREVRMRTFNQQNGHIMLAKGIAKEEKGTLWYLGGDLKFDHIWKGLSATAGYSYNRQENDELTPENTNLFDKTAVNSNSMLNGWYTHVLHFMLDYDISVHMKKTTKWAPRVNLFYNMPLDGKNAYKTDVFGGGIGFDLLW